MVYEMMACNCESAPNEQIGTGGQERVNPLTGKGGGQILPSPHVFRRYKKAYSLILTSFSVPDQK